MYLNALLINRKDEKKISSKFSFLSWEVRVERCRDNMKAARNHRTSSGGGFSFLPQPPVSSESSYLSSFNNSKGQLFDLKPWGRAEIAQSRGGKGHQKSKRKSTRGLLIADDLGTSCSPLALLVSFYCLMKSHMGNKRKDLSFVECEMCDGHRKTWLFIVFLSPLLRLGAHNSKPGPVKSVIVSSIHYHILSRWRRREIDAVTLLRVGRRAKVSQQVDGNVTMTATRWLIEINQN